MFEKIWEFINDNLLWVLLILLGIFFLIYFIVRAVQGKKGTYDTEDYTQYSHLYGGTPQNSTKKSLRAPKNSKLELAARATLERMFGKPFPNMRPNFMQNPITGHNLEIDCYNQEIGLGIEVQGRQHYEFVPYFHKTRDKFTIQKYRDEIKRRLCSEMGIALIYIPYSVKCENVEKYVVEQMQKLCPHLLYHLKEQNDLIKS